MKYTNKHLGIEIQAYDHWCNISNQFNNVPAGCEDLYQENEKDIPASEDQYKYLISSDDITTSGKYRRTSVLLCVHRSIRPSKEYNRKMMTKIMIGDRITDNINYITGEASHGDFTFRFIDQIGLQSTTRHLWCNLFGEVWLYGHLTDYSKAFDRPSLKWLGKLKKIRRNFDF
ncbi:MAG: hypothetical protein V3V74_07505 [Nitrosomonadaceae bacterium]